MVLTQWSEAHAELEVFTDGSGGDGSTAAGWGFVGVRNDAEVHGACGPVVTDKGTAGWHGAERGTNNTALLTAILKGLRWAGGLADTVVRIRYDSEYAANTARGLWKAKKEQTASGGPAGGGEAIREEEERAVEACESAHGAGHARRKVEPPSG